MSSDQLLERPELQDLLQSPEGLAVRGTRDLGLVRRFPDEMEGQNMPKSKLRGLK